MIEEKILEPLKFDFLTEAEKAELVRLLVKVGGRRTEFFYELFYE